MAAVALTVRMSPRPQARARARLASTFGLVAAVMLAAAPLHAGGAATVEVRSASYAPSEITVARGTVVTWENVTSPSRVHDVISSIEDAFASPRFGAGETFNYRFDSAGTYTYICSIHDTMLGAVYVPLTGRLVAREDGVVMRIRLAVAPLPADSPFRYVVSRSDPGDAGYAIWRYTRRPVVEFLPPAPGTYRFVMRLKNLESDRKTGPAGDSPVLQLDWAG